MRPRHDLAPWKVTALAPLFRYSYSRDAYILRGIGSKRGPVLRVRRSMTPVEPAREGRFVHDEQNVRAGRS